MVSEGAGPGDPETGQPGVGSRGAGPGARRPGGATPGVRRPLGSNSRGPGGLPGAEDGRRPHVGPETEDPQGPSRGAPRPGLELARPEASREPETGKADPRGRGWRVGRGRGSGSLILFYYFILIPRKRA